MIILVRLVVMMLIFIAARVLVGIVRKVIAHATAATAARSGHGQRRLTTLQGILTSSLAYLIYFAAFILILFTLGVSWKGLAPLLGAASVLGLALGFGAQRLVRDVITGLFILGEGQFDVGDQVVIGGVSGRVEDIGIRITRLRDEQGRLYIIANGDITQVFNASRGHVKVSIDVNVQRPVAIETSLAVIRQAALDVLQENRIPLTEEQHPAIWVTGIDAAKVTVRLVLWVPAVERDRIEDAVRRRMLQTAGCEDSTVAFV